MPEGPPNQYSDDRVLVKCEHCPRWMITVPGMRKVCRECFEKLNRSVSLNTELENLKKQRDFWEEEERRLTEKGEIG